MANNPVPKRRVVGHRFGGRPEDALLLVAGYSDARVLNGEVQVGIADPLGPYVDVHLARGMDSRRCRPG